MRSLCHYDGIFRSEEKNPIYIRVERRVVLVDGDVSFDKFESQIRRVSGSGSFPIRIIYFLKCEAMSIYANVLAQEELIAML